MLQNLARGKPAEIAPSKHDPTCCHVGSVRCKNM